jgi:cysteine desulfurase
MHANNEIGVVNDIAAIGELTRAQGIIFHVDAAQSGGKIPVDLSRLKVDLMSITAHKMYGPKGVGALFVRRQPPVRVEAQIHGGGHERGMRSGTLPTHQIVGMGEAARIALEDMVRDEKHIAGLRDDFWGRVGQLEGVQINGNASARLPGVLNISVAGVEGEALLMSLKDLAVSTGSACNSASVEPSYVLRKLGISDALAHSSIRFTFGRFTTAEEVEYAATQFCDAVRKLRGQA